jgi:hypothetical protein
MARSRRACPERSRGNPGDACWQMLLGAFRPQTTTEDKKVTNSERSRGGICGSADLSWNLVKKPIVPLIWTPLKLSRPCGAGPDTSPWPSLVSYERSISADRHHCFVTSIILSSATRSISLFCGSMPARAGI